MGGKKKGMGKKGSKKKKGPQEAPEDYVRILQSQLQIFQQKLCILI